MKRSLCPARLLCLDRRSHLLHTASVSSYRLLSYSQNKGLPNWRPSPGRRQWGRQFSVGSSPSISRRLLLDRIHARNEPPARESQENPETWALLLEQYLLGDSGSDSTASESDTASVTTSTSISRAIDLSDLLYNARTFGNLDLLAHLGFRLNNWPAVYALLNQLLDAADALNDVSPSLKHLSNNSWGYKSSVSLDQLTHQIDSAPRLTPDPTTQVSELTMLDTLSERAFADEHSRRFMAQVWQSLGSIVLDAADASPNESKIAMSYVFRILARLHHSGAVSDRVYKYVPTDSHQVAFRPPTMHLLSTHIMSVLSDAAWLVHEAEVAAKAAAAGEDSPFLPVKMGIRELGPEIWIELILWCCVEHGHITEGVWLIDQMKTRKGDLAWKFQSWRPLLQHPESVWNTKVDSEVSWRHPAQVDGPSLLRKRSSPPSPFNGLGRRTISLEVAASLMDNLPNWGYRGLGFWGITSTALLRHIVSLKFAIAPRATDDTPLTTTKESNWFILRVLESGCLDPVADPQAFDELIRAIPHVVPPWDSNDLYLPDEEDLEQLEPSQIYDETTALAKLVEHNIRFHSRRRLCGDAMDSFAWLQSAVDKSKMQRIGEFFSSRVDPSDDEHLPTFDTANLASLKPFESSMPQISPITLAELLDLVTVSRAFTFGDWLLFSNDIDGPPVPYSEYGNQALAPSIIRYAAATKNSTLCDSVVQSLSQPLSANTLRALLNYRIAMCQWNQVTVILEYLRDYRLKSWGHSNVTALAAEIIRLDHAVTTEIDATEADDNIQNLAQAKGILLRILNGDFNELHPRDNYQKRTLHGLQRLFLSIPGALHDLAASSNIRSQKLARSTTPNIPSTAFHPILAAVVDTRGSAAGKRLWDTWCVDVQSPSTRRLHKGGIPRLYLNTERDLKKGDPHFDEAYFKQLQTKLVIPNISTVRIIAQAAVKEYNEYEAKHSHTIPDNSPPSPQANAYPRTTHPQHNPVRPILDFCMKKFEALGLRRANRNRECGGFVYRRNKELKRMKRQRLRGGDITVQQELAHG